MLIKYAATLRFVTLPMGRFLKRTKCAIGRVPKGPPLLPGNAPRSDMRLFCHKYMKIVTAYTDIWDQPCTCARGGPYLW
jgi:hypothetical protein